MTRPSRTTTSGRAYLDLQARARQEGRPADELRTLYVLLRRGRTPNDPFDMYAY